MFLRRYEICFIRQDGRRVRGPIVDKKNLRNVQDFVAELNGDNRTITLTFGQRKAFIPETAFKNGHVEIRRVGLIYSLIRRLRSR